MKRRQKRQEEEAKMNNLLWIFCFIALMAIPSWSADVPSSTSSYLTDVDRTNMKKMLDTAYKFDDLSAVHYLVIGYQNMGEKVTRSAEICKFLLESANKPGLTPESIYYIVSTWKSLGVCQPKSLPSAALAKSLHTLLEKEVPTFQTLYHAINSLKTLGESIKDQSKIVTSLQSSLKKDDGILNLGYAFHIASDLGSAGSFAFNHIEDAIIQADEVDGKYLQFEGGLSVTSLIVNGIYKLSATLKKKPPMTPIQTVKFANYFLSRRSVQTSKGIANLLSSLNTLATNNYDKPTCITLMDDGVIVSSKQPLVKIKVCDILGKPLASPPSVIANTATKVGDDVVVISKKNFQATPGDKSLYTLNFLSTNPEPGFYKIAISAGTIQNTVMVKVVTDVKVDYLEIGTADADQTTQPKLSKIEHPKKLDKKLEADSQQKLVIRFLLKETIKDKPMRVHQAFIRLSSTAPKNKHEIIFVAEPDSALVYKFDMPVGTSGKMFNYQSGDYNVELIVGDAVLSNSFHWTLGTVNLKFPEGAVAEVSDKSTFKQEPNVYTMKPEIKHTFREPEKRPPIFVSNLFTGLCLLPILILLLLWIKLGVNISNFPFSMSAITFHLGLGSIFALFAIFWLQLNMFTTLRWLFALGIVTFLSGNKLLSYIAKNRKSSGR